MRACVHAEREGAGHQEIKAAAPFRGGGHAAVQTDGLLLQGGALLRREGSNDLLRQAEDPRAGQQLQPQGRYPQTGMSNMALAQVFSAQVEPAHFYRRSLFQKFLLGLI